MIGAVVPSVAAAIVGAAIGWALVRWTNIAIARLWAIALLLAAIVVFAVGIFRGEEAGIGLVIFGTLVIFPALIGSVVGMVLTEWRMQDQ